MLVSGTAGRLSETCDHDPLSGKDPTGPRRWLPLSLAAGSLSTGSKALIVERHCAPCGPPEVVFRNQLKAHPGSDYSRGPMSAPRLPAAWSARLHVLARPLAICAVAWSALHLLAWLGTLMGGPLGPAPVQDPAFVRAFPLLARRADPDLGAYAHLAAGGATKLADLHLSPVFLAVLLSVWLGRRVNRESANASLILLVAAPWSFRLSDGDPRGLALLASIAALLLADRGRRLWAGLVAAMGVLAHPVALAVLPEVWRADGGAAEKRSAAIARWCAPSFSILALAARWMVIDPDQKFRLAACFGNFAVPSEAYLWLLAPGFGLLLVGALLLGRARDWRSLSLLIIQAVLLFVFDGFSAGRELWVCVAATLALGVALARSPLALAGTYSALMLFQGLFFYLQSHRLPLP